MMRRDPASPKTLPRTFRTVAVVALLGLIPAFTASMAAAQAAQADALFQDFRPSGDFLFELGGSEVDGAEIYRSERSGAYLILAPALKSPLLINTRGGTVETVSLLKVARRDNGAIDLLADASFDSMGQFQVGAQELTFQVKGQAAKLKPKPPLLGFQTAASLVDYNPSYGFKSKSYAPDATSLRALAAQGKDVKVRVYFGTWCPVCSRLVPKVMRVAEELEGSKLSFEYYGLPRQMADDPVTDEQKLNGVPTAVVFVGEKEVGRLGGRELNLPESSLQKILAGS